MNQISEYDVVIIGAGPAGAAAATVLADHGRRVVVVEKDTFPRYRVGESLLPYCYFTLKRLGVIDQLNDFGFVKKHSVQFIGISGRSSQPFYFFQHFDHPAAQTWQVERGSFDQMLIDNARDHGATVMFDASARQLLMQDDAVVGITVEREGKTYELRAPITIDASGRDAFSLQRNDWKVPDQELRKIAMWAYFKGAMRDIGHDEGATTVAYVPEKGWFWYIPLQDDMVSAGIVGERAYLYREGKDPQAIIDREIQVNPWIAQHLASSSQIGEVRVTSDFSYRAKYCASDGLVLTGDAFAFLDPVFSSGVFMALKSGELAADAVHGALETGDVRAEQFAEYSNQFCTGLEAMRKLVYAFYDPTFSFGKMLKKHPEVRGELTDCLIGNLYRDFEPLFSAVSEFAQVPAPLSYGQPKVSTK